MKKIISCIRCKKSFSAEVKPGEKVKCPDCGIVIQCVSNAQINKNKKDKIANNKKIILGQYEIISEIARGGMGIVYKAKDIHLDRIVALKVLPPEFHNKEMVERFMREAKATASLQHPGIVTVYNVGRHGKRFYFAMEFIQGTDLYKYSKSHSLSYNEICQIMLNILDGMEYAHSKNIVHRDIKPSNILMDQNNSIKIADFGLAKILYDDNKLTRSGTSMGTPHYMAPEQARGDIDEITPATDLYSVGAVMYELIAGRPPFTGKTEIEILMKVIQKKPVPLRKIRNDVPPTLDKIVSKALHKDKNKRFSSANEFKQAIMDFQNSTNNLNVLPKKSSKKPIIFAGIGGFLLAFVLIIILAISNDNNKNDLKKKNEISQETLTKNNNPNHNNHKENIKNTPPPIKNWDELLSSKEFEYYNTLAGFMLNFYSYLGYFKEYKYRKEDLKIYKQQSEDKYFNKNNKDFAVFMCGKINEYNGNYNKAIEYYNKLGKQRRTPPDIKVLALSGKALSYYYMKNYEDAEINLKSLFRLLKSPLAKKGINLLLVKSMRDNNIKQIIQAITGDVSSNELDNDKIKKLYNNQGAIKFLELIKAITNSTFLFAELKIKEGYNNAIIEIVQNNLNEEFSKQNEIGVATYSILLSRIYSCLKQNNKAREALINAYDNVNNKLIKNIVLLELIYFLRDFGITEKESTKIEKSFENNDTDYEYFVELEYYAFKFIKNDPDTIKKVNEIFEIAKNNNYIYSLIYASYLRKDITNKKFIKFMKNSPFSAQYVSFIVGEIDYAQGNQKEAIKYFKKSAKQEFFFHWPYSFVKRASISIK